MKVIWIYWLQNTSKMFRLFRDKPQSRCGTKPIHSTKEIFESLGFFKLVEPGSKLKCIRPFMTLWAVWPLFNPKEGDNKMYAFDAHLLVESMCWFRVDLYGTYDTYWEEVLRDKALLKKEIKKLSKAEEGRVKMLTGKPDVCRQQIRAIQNSLMERGTKIERIEQRIAPLSIKPSHLGKHHNRSDALVSNSYSAFLFRNFSTRAEMWAILRFWKAASLAGFNVRGAWIPGSR